jgi:O-antigen ligase
MKSVSVMALLMSLNMICLFLNGSRYFNFGTYYVLPITTIVAGLFTTIRQKKVPFNVEQICILVIALYLFVLTYVANYGGQFDMIAATALFYIFIWVIASVNMNKANINFVINSYIASGLILAVILLIQMKRPYAHLGQFRYGIYYSDTGFYDVNFTAAYMLIPALMCVNRAIKGKTREIRMWNLLFSTIIFIAILLTGSRGSILPFLAISVFKIVKTYKKKVYFIPFAILIAVLIYFYLPKDIFERLFMKSYITTNSRRFEDWKYGLMAFSLRPWFGSGLYSSLSIISREIGEQYTAHNSFITLLIQFGIIGAIPNLVLLFYPIYRVFKTEGFGMELLYYLAFLFTIVMIEANVTPIMLIPITIIYMIINYLRENPNENIDPYIA